MRLLFSLSNSQSQLYICDILRETFIRHPLEMKEPELDALKGNSTPPPAPLRPPSLQGVASHCGKSSKFRKRIKMLHWYPQPSVNPSLDRVLRILHCSWHITLVCEAQVDGIVPDSDSCRPSPQSNSWASQCYLSRFTEVGLGGRGGGGFHFCFVSSLNVSAAIFSAKVVSAGFFC